ncbi:MAG: flagellar hook-length control protein FliK [Planctomycetes bacterium]|nr:flagellar hook-length control protein FliK [Planctomycetota bacterium]
MEPLAIQAGVSQTVRPVLALDANLSAVLREGRTVAGEVLQTLDGKSILIGVGRHRVPADSDVELAPGQRFLARVEHTAEGTVLKVLGHRADGESKLLGALREVVGDDRPVGELLEELGAALRKAVDAAGDADGKLARLVKQLGEHVFVPGATGAELARLLARAGLDHEALLSQLAHAAPAGSSAVAAGAFSEALFGELRALLSAAGAQLDNETQVKLRALLEAAVRDAGAALAGGRPDAADLAQALTARLRAALAAMPEGATRDALLEGLTGALERLLGGAPPSRPALAWLAALEGEGQLLRLEHNLKARLLGLLGALEPGPEREAVQHALAGLEAEQLLNVARKEFSEGWHLALPVPDGEHLATAHLFYRDAPEHEEGEDADAELQRMTLTVDLSRLGPLRAELGVRDDLVALRLVVTQQRVAEALLAGVEELRERLSFGGRQARVAVVVGTRDDTAVDSLSQNIRWLREHHLMDLEG